MAAVMRIIAAGVVLTGVCALPASAQISHPAAPHELLSNGQDRCSEFLAGDQQRQTIDVAWILGYITGVDSRGVSEADRAVGSSFHDGAAVAAWVQKYCLSNPYDIMARVAEALRNEFAMREGRQ